MNGTEILNFPINYNTVVQINKNLEKRKITFEGIELIADLVKDEKGAFIHSPSYSDKLFYCSNNDSLIQEIEVPFKSINLIV